VDFWVKLSATVANSISPDGALQQIGGWLKELGMSEYAERFAEEDIDRKSSEDTPLSILHLPGDCIKIAGARDLGLYGC
jgi:hypothetical protein